MAVTLTLQRSYMYVTYNDILQVANLCMFHSTLNTPDFPTLYTVLYIACSRLRHFVLCSVKDRTCPVLYIT